MYMTTGTKGEFGRLPLHAAVECAQPCEHVIRLLTASYPEGVFMITRAYPGRAPTNTVSTNTTVTGLLRVPSMWLGVSHGSISTIGGGKNGTKTQ